MFDLIGKLFTKFDIFPSYIDHIRKPQLLNFNLATGYLISAELHTNIYFCTGWKDESKESTSAEEYRNTYIYILFADKLMKKFTILKMYDVIYTHTGDNL